MNKIDDIPLSRSSIILNIIKSVLTRVSRGVSFFVAIIFLVLFSMMAGIKSAEAEGESKEVEAKNPDEIIGSIDKIKDYTPIEEDLERLEVALSFEPYFMEKPVLIETIPGTEKNESLSTGAIKYVVQNGDTISSIAEKYELKIATLKFTNNLEKEKLSPGEKIKIPEKDVPSEVIAKAEEQKRKAEAQKRALATAQRRSVVYRDESGGRNSTGNGGFLWPVGARGQNGYHWWAADIGPEGGTGIRASKSGTVVLADGSGYNGGYGKEVVIDHGNGTRTRYAHLSSISAQQGQYLSQGDILGIMGNTGRSTAIHLHFEIEENGQKVNPYKYYQ